jgi:hypothetical protein
LSVSNDCPTFAEIAEENIRNKRKSYQVDVEGTLKTVKPTSGAVIRGKGKHFAEIRDALIEVSETNPEFRLTIKDSGKNDR